MLCKSFWQISLEVAALLNDLKRVAYRTGNNLVHDFYVVFGERFFNLPPLYCTINAWQTCLLFLNINISK